MTDDKGLKSKRYVFGCDLGAVVWVHHMIPSLFREWGIPESTADDAFAVVVALVANAVKHAEWHPFYRELSKFDLDLRLMSDHLKVTVEDTSPRHPVLRELSDDNHRVRGLNLVDIVSLKWGYIPRSPFGKSVWAEIAIPRLVPGSPDESNTPQTKHRDGAA